jgi:hypothetical protein
MPAKAGIQTGPEALDSRLRQCDLYPQVMTTVEPSELVYADTCADLPSKAAPLPLTPIACVQVWAFEWVTDTTQFALLEDGSVWTWHHYVGFAPELMLVCQSAVAGGLLGVFVMGTAWAARRRRSRA